MGGLRVEVAFIVVYNFASAGVMVKAFLLAPRFILYVFQLAFVGIPFPFGDAFRIGLKTC
jgi:hypothetical protein